MRERKLSSRRIAGIALGAVVVVAAEGALAARTLEARHAADDRRSVLTQTQRELEATNDASTRTYATLDALDAAANTRTKQADRAERALTDAKAYERKAARDLAAAKLLAANASAGVRAVRECADGVGQATIESYGGNKVAAVASLRRAAQPCMRVLTAEGSSAVYPFDFSDPSLLRVGDTYYAYSTNNAAGEVQVMASADLHQWTLLGDALPSLPPWAASGNTWAPSVIAIDGTYVAYYTVRDAASGNQCVSVAAAHGPAGPFVDTTPWPLVCQHDLAGSIDPRPFVDASGQPWLVWSSPGGKLPAIVWSQPLSPDGRGLTGVPTMLAKADRPWETGVVEAPALVNTDGGLVLFYSGNHWSTPDYAVGDARCATPVGPCIKDTANPVFASHDAFAGPGSPDFVATPSGDLWMAFAAYRAGSVGYPSSRLLHVTRVHVDRSAVTFTPN